jgi:uncharacterized HAD superfamily protein
MKEYEALKEQFSLLSDSELIKKFNRLLKMMYEEKQSLYMGGDTSDLTEASINYLYKESTDAWNNV